MRCPEFKNIGLTLWPIWKTSFQFSGHVYCHESCHKFCHEYCHNYCHESCHKFCHETCHEYCHEYFHEYYQNSCHEYCQDSCHKYCQNLCHKSCYEAYHKSGIASIDHFWSCLSCSSAQPGEHQLQTTRLNLPPSYDEATEDVIPRRLPPIQHQHIADMSGKTNDMR